MNKKAIALSLLAGLLGGASVMAGERPGSWYVFPQAGVEFSDLIDTPDQVYYLTGHNLFSYDTEAAETFSFRSSGKLSDASISQIAYSPEKGFLVVVYDNSNVDIVYDDGTVVNMPDIKNANLTVSKKINSVTFAGSRVYMATDFGFVIYDTDRHMVSESGVFNRAIDYIFATPTHLIISYGYNLYAAPLEERHNTLEKFSQVNGGVYLRKMQPLADGTFIVAVGGNSDLYHMKVDGAALTRVSTPLGFTGITTLQKVSGGDIFAACKNTAVIVDGQNGQVKATITLPDELQGQMLSSWKGSTSSIWGADERGVAQYSLPADDSEGRVLIDKFNPEAFRIDNPVYTSMSADGHSLFISNIGTSVLHPANTDQFNYHQTDRYDFATRSIESLTPDDVDAQFRGCVSQQERHGKRFSYAGPTRMVADLENPDRWYAGSRLEGVMVFEGKKHIGTYNSNNSPISLRPDNWGYAAYDVNFDRQGNLWVGFWDDKDHHPYVVLPANKVKADPATVTAADWQVGKWITNHSGYMDHGTVFHSRSNRFIHWDSKYAGSQIVYDTKGTFTTADDEVVAYTGYTDQDGNRTSPNYVQCMKEDHNGRIWVGTDIGIFEIPDLGTATIQGTMSVRRPKVPRNDGTNYADYLLATDKILDIAVDHTNRKWVATAESGLYLVSANGDEILEHFTSDNSPLMNNAVYSVVCNPESNDVLVGTPNGMYLYSGDSAPAAADYSDVYAYPNPVRPDYAGWITVAGLMDDSLVKIADMQGNVFWQGRSEGGMVTWDGCNSAGERVRSGVYLVFASQNSGDSSSGVVTKIVVVN